MINMQWEHSVSAKWLRARRKYITASDIVSMLPMYNRFIKAFEKYKKDHELDEMASYRDIPVKDMTGLLREFIKFYLEKSTNESVITKSPSNDAARGHILEPYAVKEYNNDIPNATAHEMQHWDDAVIYRDDGRTFPLAFSPDATDVIQVADDVEWLYKDGYITSETENHVAPEQILEIKSYGGAKHAKKILEKKHDIEERYQIATAMCVCDSINTGHLLLYNPNSVSPVEIRTWKDSDLREEMLVVEQIHSLFTMCIEYYHTFKPKKKSLYTERQIHAEYMKEHTKEGQLLKGE